jgi:hypothetical protein
VPPLSEKLVERYGVQDRVRDLLLAADAVKPGVLIASAIQGQGGIGKTILAQLLAHDPDVRQRFPDGIYWLPLGQEPEILSILTGLIETFDPHFKPTTVPSATAHLQAWLADRACLLILDDVWQAEHAQKFLATSERSRFLLTTRRLYVATDVDAHPFSLDVMTLGEARSLFENRLGRSLEGNELAQALELARTVGYLPLALNLAATRVGNGAISWGDLTQALGQEVARLEALDGGRRLLREQSGLKASLNLSLGWLQSRSPDLWERYAWFGVLPEAAVIAAPMAATLWGLTEADAADYLELFQKESLLLSAGCISVGQRDYPGYRLHDLFHDMTRRILVLSAPEGLGLTIVQAHERLLAGYRAKEEVRSGAWSSLKDDGYIHERLTWHMEQAQQIESMVARLREETDGRNGWYTAREQLGQTAGYIQDVFRAWKQVERTAKQELDDGILIMNLATQLRFVLIVSSLNSLASNIPATVLTALVRFEVWKPITALAYIRQKPDSRGRANALIEIAPFLTPVSRREAVEVARQIADARTRSQALSGIAGNFLRMPPFRFYPLWIRLLRLAVSLARSEVLSIASALTPAVLEFGGPDAVGELVAAIQDVGRWWP